MEEASGRGVDRGWNLPLEYLALSRSVGVGDWDGRKQRLGVRVQGVAVKQVSVSYLSDSTEIAPPASAIRIS